MYGILKAVREPVPQDDGVAGITSNLLALLESRLDNTIGLPFEHCSTRRAARQLVLHRSTSR
jgi:ribosomal protein S4